jgi:hypothetical protein
MSNELRSRDPGKKPVRGSVDILMSVVPPAVIGCFVALLCEAGTMEDVQLVVTMK